MIAKQLAKKLYAKEIKMETLHAYLELYKLSFLYPRIAHHLKTMHLVAEKRDRLYIESAFPLGAQALALILDKVMHVEEKAKVTVNKELLAGFIAHYKGKKYDASARRIINKLTH